MSTSQSKLTSETLTGVIERVTFHNQETGFCVLRLHCKGHRNLVTVVGLALSVNSGESINACGHWVHDRAHGLQFKATHIEVVAPTSLIGIEKYLSSGLVKGIGPHFAKTLVAAFGEKTLEIIDSHPEKLLKLPGIGKIRQQQLLAGWQEQKVMRDIIIFLQSYQISSARAVRIYKTYGDQAIQKIKENPYRLAQDIYGIGFKTADTLAHHMGIPQDSLIRATAGLQHVMQTLSTEGHSAVLIEDLENHTQKLLSIETTIIQKAIEDGIIEGHLIRTEWEEKPIVALSSLYHMEKGIATQLQRLLVEKNPPWGLIDPNRVLSQLVTHQNINLSQAQKSVLVEALQAKVFILTGGPGVGKTTIVKNLLNFLQKQAHLRIMLCAPTGRAAQRLHETTGWPAKTIHRLLGFDPKKFGFKYNQHDLLPIDVLIIDEASMLDINLTHQLLKALADQTALFFIGDSDQLPSVGPGRVLADLIATECIPFAKLTQIFRQAATSKIITNAHRINQGYMPALAPSEDSLSDFYFIEADTPESIQEKIIQLVSVRIPRRFNLHPIQDIQVLTPMNRGNIGAHHINHLLQATLNPHKKETIERFGTRFMVGDKIIQQLNNYDKEIFNGDIGYISAIYPEIGFLEVKFEGRMVEYNFNELDEITLAYAMSIHKSQGSEYPAVVIPIAMQHYRMLARNLLYTGVTRGKQLVILVGQKKALGIAVHTTQSNQRLTQLQEHIKKVL